MLGPLLVCCAMVLAPRPEAEGQTDATTDREAAALFDSGQAKYETHDYAGAIADFTAAYNLALELEDPSLRDEALARLAYNLARTHVSAYDIDADVSHLEIARRLLADFRGHERAMGRDPDADTDVERLELDLLEREKALAQTSSEPVSDEPVPSSGATSAKARAQRRAGISLLAIAPAFAGLAVAGGVLGSQARDDFDTVTTGDARLDAQRLGRTGDVLFGVGIGLAAASAIAGVTLVVIARPDRPQQLAVKFQPNGIALEGRF